MRTHRPRSSDGPPSSEEPVSDPSYSERTVVEGGLAAAAGLTAYVLERGVDSQGSPPLAFVGGEQQGPVSLGRAGQFRIDGRGVLATHGYLMFDGDGLYLCSADEANPMVADGVRIPRQWTRVGVPTTLILGRARAVLRSSSTAAPAKPVPRGPRALPDIEPAPTSSEAPTMAGYPLQEAFRGAAAPPARGSRGDSDSRPTDVGESYRPRLSSQTDEEATRIGGDLLSSGPHRSPAGDDESTRMRPDARAPEPPLAPQVVFPRTDDRRGFVQPMQRPAAGYPAPAARSSDVPSQVAAAYVPTAPGYTQPSPAYPPASPAYPPQAGSGFAEPIAPPPQNRAHLEQAAAPPPPPPAADLARKSAPAAQAKRLPQSTLNAMIIGGTVLALVVILTVTAVRMRSAGAGAETANPGAGVPATPGGAENSQGAPSPQAPPPMAQIPLPAKSGATEPSASVAAPLSVGPGIVVYPAPPHPETDAPVDPSVRPAKRKSGDAPPPTLERAAVDAMNRGDLTGALTTYRQLAQQQPDNPAFANAVRVIQSKLTTGTAP